MSDIFRLPSSEFQKAYDLLRKISSHCNDDIQPVAPSMKSKISADLTECDFSSFQINHRRQRTGYVMTNLSGTRVFVAKQGLLQRLYQHLVRLDRLDGTVDGRIDPKKSPKELFISEDSSEAVSNVFFRIYGDAVFEVTKTPAPFGSKSQGSAFIIEKTPMGNGNYRYLLVTNRHVVDTRNLQELRWTLSHPKLRGRDRALDAKVVGIHSPADVALLEIELEQNLPVLRLGDSTNLRGGQKVVAIGNTIGRGLIAIEGTILSPHDGIEGYPYGLIRPEINVNHGNSGGPLLHAESGDVVGMVVAGDDRASSVANFSIPASRIRKAVEAIKASKETEGVVVGYWGFNFMPLTPEERQEIASASASGIWITEVFSGSPAAQVGMKAGDILLAVNGDRQLVQIDRPMDNYRLTSFILDSRPGQTCQLIVLREGVVVTLNLTAGSTRHKLEKIVHTEYPFAVRDIEESERQLEELSYEGVLAILDNPQRPLFDHLFPGNVIFQVDGVRTPTVDIFVKTLQEKKEKAATSGRKTVRLDLYHPPSKTTTFVLLPAMK